MVSEFAVASRAPRGRAFGRGSPPQRGATTHRIAEQAHCSASAIRTARTTRLPDIKDLSRRVPVADHLRRRCRRRHVSRFCSRSGYRPHELAARKQRTYSLAVMEWIVIEQSARLMEVLKQVKKLAQEYRTLTGRPLGVTGEVAEYEAANILHLTLAAVRQEGFDATELSDGVVERIQIKGRCLQPNSKRSQRLGGIDVEKDWDRALMVLLDENLEATGIWEANRESVVAELRRPGSRARTERGAMAVSRFKKIGTRRWP